MSMFDDLIVNARSAVDTVSGKAGKVIDRTKLFLAASDIKAELSKKYHILGRVCYEANKTGQNYDSGIKQLHEEIKELNEQLATVNEMIENTREKIKCPECSTYNARGAVYCNKCGKKLPVTKPLNEDEFTEEELLSYAEETFDEEL